MPIETELHWIRNQVLLLEIERGDAWVRTEKWESSDVIPAFDSRAPVFKLQVFSDPDEYGERKTLDIRVNQQQITQLMEIVAQENERYTTVKDRAGKELAEITQTG